MSTRADRKSRFVHRDTRPLPAQKTGTLRGVVERITFQSPDTGFTVARLRAEGQGSEPVTVVGEALSLAAGESVVMEGEWARKTKSNCP